MVFIKTLCCKHPLIGPRSSAATSWPSCIVCAQFYRNGELKATFQKLSHSRCCGLDKLLTLLVCLRPVVKLFSDIFILLLLYVTSQNTYKYHGSLKSKCSSPCPHYIYLNGEISLIHLIHLGFISNVSWCWYIIYIYIYNKIIYIIYRMYIYIIYINI